MESSIERVVSSTPLHAIRERRESRDGRDPRSSGFRRALGGAPIAPALADDEVRSDADDAGVPLDEEPGRIVDFAA